MMKFIKFLLLVILVATVAWSAPSAFLQDANAYDGGGSELITLQFHGTLVSPGSCEQIANDSIECTVSVGQKSEFELTATVTPSDTVSITTVGFLPYVSAFSPATSYGTVTTTWFYTPNTSGTYEATFRASAAGLSVELRAVFNVVLSELPKIEVSPSSLDFGEIAVNTTAQRELTIKNVGDADLWVSNVAIEGGAGSAFDLCGIVWTAATLPPGGSTNLTVCFSPRTAGSFNDHVLITSSDPTAPTVTVPVQGNATKKKSTISCTFMAIPKPGGRTDVQENTRETLVKVTVEISPPRSVAYTIKITDANGGAYGSITFKTESNGKDERVFVLNGKLRDGKLEGTWRCEVSWKGDDQCEGASGQCTFNVSDLGSYAGTEAGPSATCSTRPSNRIDVTYNGFCTQNCSKIVFIQVFSDAVKFTNGSWVALKPSQTDSDPATFGFLDNDAVKIGNAWFTVDYLNGESDPYYNGDDADDLGVQGKHNTQTITATMQDPPTYDQATINAIEAAYNKTVLKIITEFETFAFCVGGADKGKFYQGVKWRYELQKGAAGNGDSIITEVVSEPSEEFKKALKKWCDNHPPFVLPNP